MKYLKTDVWYTKANWQHEEGRKSTHTSQLLIYSNHCPVILLEFLSITLLVNRQTFAASWTKRNIVNNNLTKPYVIQ